MVFDRTAWRSDQPGPWIHGPLGLPHNGRLGTGELVTVGRIIVHQRTARRVLEVRERPEDLWPEPWERTWRQLVAERERREAERLAGVLGPWGAPVKPRPPLVRREWPARPAEIIVRDAARPRSKVVHRVVRVDLQWQILPEHYSVCRLCGELPPCRHEETEATVAEEMRHTERLMDIPRGACLGCGTAITTRMKAVSFPGPNLWRPDLGPDSAVFHLRDRSREHECTTGAARYREQWTAQGLDALTPRLPEGDH